MEKSIFLLIILLSTRCCFAQGLVSFVNSIPGDHLVYFDTVGGLPVVGTNLVAELYYGLDANSLTPLPASISHFRPPTTASPGTWSGGKDYQLPIGGVGTTIFLDVKVWDITLYADYESAIGKPGWIGESGPFTYSQYVTPPGVSGTRMENLPPFALSQVPEPTFFALALFGCLGFVRPSGSRPSGSVNGIGILIS